MTNLEKQLIVLNQLGIYITKQDGHRWINYQETENYNFDEELNKNGILLNSKIYGGVKEAIMIIDMCFQMMHDGMTLLNYFDCFIKTEDIFLKSRFKDNRIDRVEVGKGGLN